MAWVREVPVFKLKSCGLVPRSSTRDQEGVVLRLKNIAPVTPSSSLVLLLSSNKLTPVQNSALSKAARSNLKYFFKSTEMNLYGH